MRLHLRVALRQELGDELEANDGLLTVLDPLVETNGDLWLDRGWGRDLLDKFPQWLVFREEPGPDLVTESLLLLLELLPVGSPIDVGDHRLLAAQLDVAEVAVEELLLPFDPGPGPVPQLQVPREQAVTSSLEGLLQIFFLLLLVSPWIVVHLVEVDIDRLVVPQNHLHLLLIVQLHVLVVRD